LAIGKAIGVGFTLVATAVLPVVHHKVTLAELSVYDANAAQAAQPRAN
jgi:hypothetical protein